MMVHSKGTRNRFADDLSGNHIERERKKGGCGVFLSFGKRFCETCKSYKPSDKSYAQKGWKCSECKKGGNK